MPTSYFQRRKPVAHEFAALLSTVLEHNPLSGENEATARVVAVVDLAVVKVVVVRLPGEQGRRCQLALCRRGDGAAVGGAPDLLTVHTHVPKAVRSRSCWRDCVCQHGHGSCESLPPLAGSRARHRGSGLMPSAFLAGSPARGALCGYIVTVTVDPS